MLIDHILDTALSTFRPIGVVINNHTQGRYEMKTQIRALARTFEFIGIDDLLRIGTRQGKRPFCLITFDDGKKINLEAAEVLLHHGIPAAFFLCTDYIGSPRALWFDQLEALRNADHRAVEQFKLSQPKHLSLDLIQSRLDEALDSVQAKINLTNAKILSMNWDDVRTLAKWGFSIGSHGKNHAILTNEALGDAERDIRQSITKIESEIGLPCQSFAFPNGNYTGTLANIVFDSGINLVFTTEPTWVTKKRLVTRFIPRIQLHDKQTAFAIKTKLLAARLGCVLKDPNGTGRRYCFTGSLRSY